MAKNTEKELRNKMMYQVFVRNYSEEGTFKGVEKDLDRIKNLGTDIIYLLPIHPIGLKNRKGTLGSPYSIKDYRSINPEYGTLDDFKELVNAIHDKGMKCMIDVVYNHTSWDSLLSVEHPEWFIRKQDGSFGNRVGEWSDIIDLNYDVKGLWDYQIETLEYWAQFVDGFRCDVAPMVPLEFWLEARTQISRIKEDFIWLAESLEERFIRYLRSVGINALSDSEIFKAFDIAYDYDTYPALADYLEDKGTLKEYIDLLNKQEEIYPDNYVKLRFLENHDRARAHSLFTDEKVLKNLTAFSFFLKGMAFIYAGQEFSRSHLPSLFEKDTIILKPEDGIDLSDYIKKLSEIKKDTIFTDSNYSVKPHIGDIVTAVHEKGNKKAVGIFSFKGHGIDTEVDLNDGIYKNLIDGKNIEIKEGKIINDGDPIIIIN